MKSQTGVVLPPDGHFSDLNCSCPQSEHSKSVRHEGTPWKRHSFCVDIYLKVALILVRKTALSLLCAHALTARNEKSPSSLANNKL